MWKLPGNRREIALTFDDGPSNETAKFLALLNKLGVRASFFLCGRNVERRPGLAREIVKAGHEVGNHTYSHPFLPMCSPTSVRAELAGAQAVIAEATGRRPTLFRPPFGYRSPALARLLPEMKLHGVHWTVIGMDWKWSAARIARRVLTRTRPGSIVCLHDGDRTRPTTDRNETLEAVKLIVPQLKERGYRFVALPGGVLEAPGLW